MAFYNLSKDARLTILGLALGIYRFNARQLFTFHIFK